MSFLRPRLFASCAALFVILFTVWYAVAQPVHEDADTVYIGLLEDDRRQLDRLGWWDATPVPGRTIAPAFEKTGDRWKSIINLNRNVNWTVAFDGKNLGRVESEPVPQAALGNVTGPTSIHSILTPTKEVPVVGKPEGRFSGSYGKLVRRPLVVVSKPNFSDPDEWKPRAIPNDVIDELRASSHRTFRHLRQCDASGEALKDDWSIPDSEIVVSKSYGSTKHEYVIETSIRHNKCLFNVDGDDFQSMGGNQMFFVSATHKAVLLGLQWELVDAGDYDADGKSEVIFYVAEGKDIDIETEGYVLFYDDFRRNVRFVWKNH